MQLYELGAAQRGYICGTYLVICFRDCCSCVQVLDVSIPQYSNIWQDEYYIQGATTACSMLTGDSLRVMLLELYESRSALCCSPAVLRRNCCSSQTTYMQTAAMHR